MGKIEQILDDLQLNRYELQALVTEAQRRLDAIRPVHIKEVYKKCGKFDCWCAQTYSTGDGHGPYLYAVWTEHGRQVQRSLGLKMAQHEIEAAREVRRPDWMDFVVVGKALKKMQADGQKKWDLQERELNPIDFERFYGLAPDEDGLGRPRQLWFNWREYNAAAEKYNQAMALAYNKYTHWGVMTSKGVALLDRLISEGFYPTY